MEKQVEQGFGNRQHLQDNKWPKAPPGYTGLAACQKAEGPLAFLGYFIFPFYNGNMHGSVFAPEKITSRQIGVK